MQEIAAYHLPHSVDIRTVIGIVAFIFAVSYVCWRYDLRKARQEGAVQGKTPYAHGECRRFAEMAVMVGVCIASVALFVAVGPTVYHELGRDIWRLGEPTLLFTFGLFCMSVALVFVSVREFFRLLRP